MKTLILLAVLLIAAPAFADHERDDGDDDDYQRDEQSQRDYAPPDQGPTYDDFRNDSELSWNGEWIETPEYGTVWRPTRVSNLWQPYMYGRWAWTNAGWAWVSEEPFGWATYHYGRWAFSPAGWLWIPGRVWAPAWVSWRWGEGYAGWCPLGPRSYVYQQPAQYVFVRNQHFLEPVRSNVVPRPLAGSLLAPSGSGPHAGPPLRTVEQATGRTVRPLAVTDAPAPHAAQATSGSIGFYRPRTAPVALPSPGPRAQQSGPYGQPTPRPQQTEPRGQPGPRAQQAGPRGSQPTQPIYSGGGPGPRQGGQQRPQPAPRAGVVPHAAPGASAKER